MPHANGSQFGEKPTLNQFLHKAVETQAYLPDIFEEMGYDSCTVTYELDDQSPSAKLEVVLSKVGGYEATFKPNSASKNRHSAVLMRMLADYREEWQRWEPNTEPPIRLV